MYLEQLDLREWQNKSQIREQLKRHGIEADLDLRAFRNEVKRNNELWSKGLSGYYIAHSQLGYKLATETGEIDRSLVDLEKRAFSMLKDIRRTRMAVGLKGQGQYNNLAEIRKNRGLTGMALVRLMKEKDPKFDSPTLSRIENGKVLPTAETLANLADILGCETWEIVSPQYLM